MNEPEIFSQIRNDIENNDVVLFMKGNARFPQCGFSATVAGILDHYGIAYKDVNVLVDPALRDGIKQFTNWPTIPQLYLKGEFVGGCDIVRDMAESGEFLDLLKEKGIAFNAAA